MMEIERHGQYDAIVTEEKVGFVFSSTNQENIRDLINTRSETDNFDWTNNRFQILGDELVLLPHGNYNDLPTLIRDVVYRNYIAPGLLTKKTNILWGNGPVLYTEKIEGNQTVRTLVEDNEVTDWLESFDHKDYLLKNIIDYHAIEGNYTLVTGGRGVRIGKPFIAKLEHISSKDCRLVGKQPSPEYKPTPVKAAVSDYGFFRTQVGVKLYDLFDYKNPFKHKHSIHYSNLPAFCVDFYSLPDIYGTLEWMRRSTAIPLLLKAMSKNGINIKYHIESPSRFWEGKKAEIKKKCTERGIIYTDKMFDDFQADYFRQVTKVLSGAENAGKFWHTVKIYDNNGVNLLEAGWTIKPIDQNLKDFIESHIKLSERADYAVTSGLQLHSALGGVGQTGKSDSGSEQLYAIKNYLSTSVRIPEMIVTKTLNLAIKANWPEKRLSIGFEHPIPQREQEITPSKRLTNNI